MIGFLDDDNTWLPGHLAAHAAVRSPPWPTLSYSGVEVVDTAGTVIDVLDRPWSRARACAIGTSWTPTPSSSMPRPPLFSPASTGPT